MLVSLALFEAFTNACSKIVIYSPNRVIATHNANLLRDILHSDSSLGMIATMTVNQNYLISFSNQSLVEFRTQPRDIYSIGYDLQNIDYVFKEINAVIYVDSWFFLNLICTE